MRKLHAFVLFGWLTMLIVACNTEVELCEELHHPHYAQVEYRYSWNNDNTLELEDSMLVLATRVVNQWKSSVRVSSTGNPSRGTYLWNAPEDYMDEPEEPEKPETPDNPENTDENETSEDSETSEDTETSGDSDSPATTRADETPDNEVSRFKLRSGDYKFVTFNRSDEEINYETVDRYMRDDAMPISELNVVYRTYGKGDPNLNLIVEDWVDYNGYGGVDRYMQPSLHPIYYDTISVRPLRSNGIYQITFEHPTRLTQHITLNFDVQKVIYNQPFTIDSVFVEMAGVPYIINLATGYIDITKTKKMMFKAIFEKDTETSNRISCQAMMDVPTIVHSESDDLYMGPGIMQVMICCSATDPDDPTQRRNKKFQGIINLYHTLEKADLIRYTEDGQHALRNKEEAVLVISAEMKVDGDQVLENPDDNAGLDVWRKKGSTIIVDI